MRGVTLHITHHAMIFGYLLSRHISSLSSPPCVPTEFFALVGHKHLLLKPNSSKPRKTLLALPTKALKDIVFRFIIEYIVA